MLAPEASQTIDPVSVNELKQLLHEPAVQVVDVRESSERDEGYIPGSTNIPFRLLRKLGPGALERSRPVADGGVATFDGDVVSFRRCGG